MNIGSVQFEDIGGVREVSEAELSVERVRITRVEHLASQALRPWLLQDMSQHLFRDASSSELR